MNRTALDRHGWILAVFGVGLLSNALWMLVGPLHWYNELPAAVPDTGPFNPHMVRDIGCAFLTCGVALIWAAMVPAVRFPLTAMVTVFLVAHALLHIYDTATGNLPSDHWVLDFAGVYAPVLVLGWLLPKLSRGLPAR